MEWITKIRLESIESKSIFIFQENVPSALYKKIGYLLKSMASYDTQLWAGSHDTPRNNGGYSKKINILFILLK